MNKKTKKAKLQFFILALLVSPIGINSLFADTFPPTADPLSLDHKFHDVGQVWQVITNLGYLGHHCFTTYAPIKRAEYPIGSGNSYLYTGSLLFAGIKDGQKLFSMADAWSEFSSNCAYEFFPTSEPWDTVWVVNAGETVDIPYLPDYKGLADQDLVCRYRDYQIRPEDQVAPLGLEVIQISHAWASAQVNEWILFEYFVIPRDSIEDVWIAQWAGASLINGQGRAVGHDNLVYFDEDRYMGVVEDLPDNNDDMPGPIGFIVFPPEGMAASDLSWTFNNRRMTDHFDPNQYDIMAAGTIDPPSNDGDLGDRGFFRLGFGPLDLVPGDTVHFFVGEVFGQGKEAFLNNADRLVGFKELDFQAPLAPPPPTVRVVPGNHTVTLNWEPQAGAVNPEEYQDSFLSQIYDQPFEGYRIYKSLEGIGGPWTLLVQFDVAGNPFFENTGIQREYTDFGLLNNLEYFYSVTSVSKPDTVSQFPVLESSIAANAIKAIPGTSVPETVGDVYVVPNPYRGDIAYRDFKPSWEPPGQGRARWTENDRRIQFVNLPSPSEIRIYTMAGDLVQTIVHDDPNLGIANWDIISSAGQAVSSGIYLFTVEDKNNSRVQVGKFVIIK